VTVEVCLNCGYEAPLDELENTDACPGCGEDGEFIIMSGVPENLPERFVLAFQVQGWWHPIPGTYTDHDSAVRDATKINRDLGFPVRMIEQNTGRQIGSWS
jgi:hypothetical protein